jgi:cysteine dioxygenase
MEDVDSLNSSISNDKSSHGRILELEDLVKELKSVPGDSSGFHDTIGRIGFGADAVEKHRHFDQLHYTRNLIARTARFELLALCWEPGQITPIHDHAGSDGWVTCLSSEIEEVRYQCSRSEGAKARVERGATLRARAGDSTYINDGIAWHTVANPTLERAISLHLYSGPIDACEYFDPESRTIKSRQMTYFPRDGVIL